MVFTYFIATLIHNLITTLLAHLLNLLMSKSRIMELHLQLCLHSSIRLPVDAAVLKTYTALCLNYTDCNNGLVPSVPLFDVWRSPSLQSPSKSLKLAKPKTLMLNKKF